MADLCLCQLSHIKRLSTGALHTEQLETTHMSVSCSDLPWSLGLDAVAQADVLVGEFGPSWQGLQDLQTPLRWLWDALGRHRAPQVELICTRLRRH